MDTEREHTKPPSFCASREWFKCDFKAFNWGNNDSSQLDVLPNRKDRQIRRLEVVLYYDGEEGKNYYLSSTYDKTSDGKPKWIHYNF